MGYEFWKKGRLSQGVDCSTAGCREIHAAFAESSQRADPAVVIPLLQVTMFRSVHPQARETLHGLIPGPKERHLADARQSFSEAQ